MFYLMIRVGPRRFETAHAHWGHIETTGDEDAWTTLPHDVIDILADWRRKLASIIGREVGLDDAIFPVLGRVCGSARPVAARWV